MVFMVVVCMIVLLVVFLIYLDHKYLISTKYYDGEEKLIGKTVVITGGNAGIGKETAVELARRGARVIIGCRNLEKAKAAVIDIKKQTLNEDVDYRYLDLSDLDTVRSFAENLKETESHIDILVNNAGVLDAVRYTSGPRTKQGFDIVFGTNYLGHFLLTYLLLDVLKASPDGARIINVSSVVHKLVLRQLNFDNNENVSGIRYPHLSGYQVSKLANVIHATELANQLKGSSVTANAFHPGLVNTNIFSPFEASNIIKRKLVDILCRKRGMDARAGAQTAIFLAVNSSVQLETGKYFHKNEEAVMSSFAKDDEKCKELWEWSKKMCDIE